MCVAYRPVMSQKMHFWRERSMLQPQQFRTDGRKRPVSDDSAHTRCPHGTSKRRKIWHNMNESDPLVSLFDYSIRNPIVSPHSSEIRGGRFE
jgi:hypothetical protein